MVFDDAGTTLAVTCPRYNRLVLLDIPPKGAPVVKADLELPGRPVAVAFAFGRFYVLQRPAGDARHTEPGFWQTCSPGGRQLGPRHDVGYDPDDLIVSVPLRRVFVLLSGKAEGETNRPAPSLEAWDVDQPDSPQHESSFAFEQSGDDPLRLAAAGAPPGANGFSASIDLAVTLAGSNRVVHLPFQPGTGFGEAVSTPLSEPGVPAGLAAEPDGSLLVTTQPRGEAWRFPEDGSEPLMLPHLRPLGELVAMGGLDPGRPSELTWFATRPKRSVLVVATLETGGRVDELRLVGPWGFGVVEPVGLAAGKGTLAVCDRSGGIHLIRLITAAPLNASSPAPSASPPRPSEPAPAARPTPTG